MNEGIRVHVVEYGRKNLYMRFTDPITGKQTAKSTGTRNKTEAIRVAAKWEAELQEGRYKSPSRITWDDFRERYESEAMPALARGTWCKVISVFNSIEKLAPVNRMAALTSEHISKWQGALRDSGLSEATIKSHLGHLQSSLNWAKDIGLITSVPKMRMPKRAKNAKLMKGRPITTEEFDRMVQAVPQVVGADRSASWDHLLHGLWWSGLRITEALNLTWDGPGIRVELSGKFPALMIPAECQKSNKDEVLPIAPEFARMLLETPDDQRTGFVFNPLRKRSQGRFKSPRDASRTIREIGRKANVKVDEYERGGKSHVKFATAHDFRRAFGTRWSSRVMPVDLQKLMRHANIETTMKFYVNNSADDIAQRLYSAEVGDTSRAIDKIVVDSPDGNSENNQQKNKMRETGIEPARP